MTPRGRSREASSLAAQRDHEADQPLCSVPQPSQVRLGTGLIDRAVIDGAGVLTSRIGPLVWSSSAVGAVSPFLHTRAVNGLFSGMIGMDEAGRSDLRTSSPRAFRRAFVEGLPVRRLPRRDARPVPGSARRRGE
jgi:hypothetical protein